MCPVPPAEHSCLVSGNGSQHYNDSCWRTFICRESGQQQVVDSINARDAGAGPRKHNSWYAILFGQAIALALSCANAASSTLENKYQIKVPTFLTGIVYFLLCFHLVHLLWRHRIKQQKSKGCYKIIEETLYLLLRAMFMVEVNQLTMGCAELCAGCKKSSALAKSEKKSLLYQNNDSYFDFGMFLVCFFA